MFFEKIFEDLVLHFDRHTIILHVFADAGREVMAQGTSPIIHHIIMGDMGCQGSSCIWSTGIVSKTPDVINVLCVTNT